MTRRKTSDAAACIGRQALPVMIGIVLALVVGLLATVIGFDRDRSLYPVILIVIASYYCLFAVMGGSAHALIVETAIFAAFGALAVLGFKTNMGWIIAALAAHGVMDLFHQGIVTNAGVPSYGPNSALPMTSPQRSILACGSGNAACFRSGDPLKVSDRSTVPFIYACAG